MAAPHVINITTTHITLEILQNVNNSFMDSPI